MFAAGAAAAPSCWLRVGPGLSLAAPLVEAGCVAVAGTCVRVDEGLLLDLAGGAVRPAAAALACICSLLNVVPNAAEGSSGGRPGLLAGADAAGRASCGSARLSAVAAVAAALADGAAADVPLWLSSPAAPDAVCARLADGASGGLPDVLAAGASAAGCCCGWWWWLGAVAW